MSHELHFVISQALKRKPARTAPPTLNPAHTARKQTAWSAVPSLQLHRGRSRTGQSRPAYARGAPNTRPLSYPHGEALRSEPSPRCSAGSVLWAAASFSNDQNAGREVAFRPCERADRRRAGSAQTRSPALPACRPPRGARAAAHAASPRRRPARRRPPAPQPGTYPKRSRRRRSRPAPRRSGARTGSRRRRPARPTWAGPAGAGPGAAACLGGNTRAEPKLCARRRRKHPSGERGGKSRAACVQEGVGVGYRGFCVPPRQRSQSRTGSAEPPARCQRGEEEGKAGCAAGSGGYRGNGERGDASPPMGPSPGQEPALPILAWGTAEVAEWVSGLGFPQYQVRGCRFLGHRTWTP